MKSLILFILVQFFYYKEVKSQDNKNDSFIVELVIKEVNTKSEVQILDTVNINKKLPDKLKAEILKGKYYENQVSTINFETGERVIDQESKLVLSLTEKEKKFIISEIPKTTIWNTLNLKNKTIVSAKAKDMSCIITITKPIYFRNESICFITWGAYGKDCGITGRDFYIKKNNQWEKLYEFPRGNF